MQYKSGYCYVDWYNKTILLCSRVTITQLAWVTYHLVSTTNYELSFWWNISLWKKINEWFIKSWITDLFFTCSIDEFQGSLSLVIENLYNKYIKHQIGKLEKKMNWNLNYRFQKTITNFLWQPVPTDAIRRRTIKIIDHLLDDFR